MYHENLFGGEVQMFATFTKQRNIFFQNLGKLFEFIKLLNSNLKINQQAWNFFSVWVS
jgi:hypothetical protein